MRRTVHPLIVLVLALALSACAASEARRPFEMNGPVWPPPPEQARLQFVGQFSGPNDLGIRPTVWNRIVGALSGPIDRTLQRPMSVAATADGSTIYVADPGVGVVHRCDLVRGRYDRLTPGRR